MSVKPGRISSDDRSLSATMSHPDRPVRWVAGQHRNDLASLPIRELMRRHPGLADKVEEVILGCANQAGEDNRTSRAWPSCSPALPDAVRV